MTTYSTHEKAEACAERARHNEGWSAKVVCIDTHQPTKHPAYLGLGLDGSTGSASFASRRR